MIKTLLKHIIGEQAIDSFFRGLNRNLKTNNKSYGYNDFYVGQKIKRITCINYRGNKKVYETCVIKQFLLSNGEYIGIRFTGYEVGGWLLGSMLHYSFNDIIDVEAY